MQNKIRSFLCCLFFCAIAAMGGTAPALAAEPRQTTLPSGTTLEVRVMDSVSSRNTFGSQFTTRLNRDVTIGGTVAIPAGTVIYGRVQSVTPGDNYGRGPSIELKLTELSLRGQSLHIETDNYRESAAPRVPEPEPVRAAPGSSSQASYAYGLAPGGGIVGGYPGGHDAMNYGSAIGVLRRPQVITITPGATLQFRLVRPVTINLTF